MLVGALRLLALLGRHGARVIPTGVFLGLLLPPLAALLRPLLVPAIVLPFLVALVRLDPGRLRQALARPLALLVALGWVLLASPLVVFLLTRPLGLPEAIESAMVLTAGCAPLMASGALALMLGLDAALAVVVTVAATALVPVTLPPLALGLLGIALEIEAGRLMLRLGAIVGGCFALAQAMRRWPGEGWIRARAAELDGLAVLALLVFSVAIMDGVAALLLVDPGFVLRALVATVGLNVGLQGLAALLYLGSGPRHALTMGLVSGNKNMGLILAALGERAPFELVVYVAMAQFPIYLLPALQRALYGRLLARAAGPPSAGPSSGSGPPSWTR